MATSKTMLTLLMKLAAVLLAGLLAVCAIAGAILGGEGAYGDTYQSVIQRKYEKLCNIESPKIIIIGGSNVGFGLDAALMEEETGYGVVSMGLHAGFGQLFNTEIAKGHIGPGDIVILAYEYGISSASFEKLGDIDLIMTGIDNNLAMYREIPLKNMPEILNHLFAYAQGKAKPRSPVSGVYSSSSFDALGNMTVPRETYKIENYEEKVNTYGAIYAANLLAPGEAFPYLQELRKYIEDRGASVYFTAPVLLENAFHGTEQDLLDYAAEMERRTGIPYISNPFDYVFPSEFMFDTIYHCNDAGEEKRTMQLIQDLRSYGILD